MAIFITPGGGGGGTPGGSDTEIQFNDGGAFGGDADLTYNKTTNLLTTKGDVRLDDSGTYTTTLQVVTPTANRTISLPDATGTVALVAGSSGQVVYNNAGAYAGISTMTFDGTNVTLSGRLINSYTSVASSPAKVFTGTWFTGGTATTTKPHFLIEPTGATSTAWSTSGTGLGVNATSGFAGNLLDLQVNGSTVYTFPASGLSWKIGNLVASSSGNLTGGGYSASNNLHTALGTISLGGTVSFNGSGDVILNRDAADTLAQRRATNAQTFRVYNTFTSATNFERLNVCWTSNEAILDTEAGSGGGTLRGLKIGSASTSLLGFYGATPVVQPTAVADITTTATAGTLPTPNGTVTIADATTPTVTELLEYCVELEAKLEAALGRLRNLGLIAT